MMSCYLSLASCPLEWEKNITKQQNRWTQLHRADWSLMLQVLKDGFSFRFETLLLYVTLSVPVDEITCGCEKKEGKGRNSLIKIKVIAETGNSCHEDLCKWNVALLIKLFQIQQCCALSLPSVPCGSNKRPKTPLSQSSDQGTRA